MPAVALSIYVTFLATAIGWRMWLQHRRTGDHGLRGFSGGRGFIEWVGGLFLVIGAGLAGAAPAAELVGLVQPFRAASWFSSTGLVLALCGLAVTVVAQHQMCDSWRIGVDARETTPLVTVGLFALVRNPIFSGMLLATAGLLLLAPNLISAVAFGALLLGLEVQVRAVEEPHLARVHGTRYLSYARSVGRFMLWLGRLP